MINKLNTLRKYPWYLLLLPLFFVLHGYAENFGFINFSDIAILAVVYIVVAILLYLLFFLFFKNRARSALASFYILVFYFFFGAIQDFFKIHLNFLNKYSILLPVFIIAFILLIVYLKTTRSSFLKLTLFFNFLFLTFVLVDSGTIVLKKINPPADKLSAYSFEKNNDFSNCVECEKPDIFFLLFDEYASSVSLQKHFNYDNRLLDTFLINQGFHIQKESKSNYNFTPFSMASMLNMSYLAGINPSAISIEDYARCNELIKNNAVISFLSIQGYEIINYSIFDLAGNPSLVSQNILPLKTKLITDRTLFGRMRKDLGWMLFTGKFKIKWLSDKLFYDNMRNNETILSKLEQSSLAQAKTPRFFYGHLFMPHPPFYFDGKGNMQKSDVVYKVSKDINTEAYLEYVTYTNTRLKKLITAIKQNTKGRAVIIFMGDHGFRKPTIDKDTSHFFENQNAVYFPGNYYRLFNNHITGVNQFRVIFNALFQQEFPLLKDSTFFLADKK